jgi:hypothetical protein
MESAPSGSSIAPRYRFLAIGSQMLRERIGSSIGWQLCDQPAQIGYVLTTNSGIKLAVHVLAFSNTVTWQFRYEPVPGQPNEGWTHW